MIYLSIDPGESTGIALYDFYNRTLSLMTIRLSEVLEMILHFEIDFVVMESLPQNPDFSNRDKMYYFELKRHILNKYKTAFVEISPSAWKPVAKRLEWKCPQAVTQHSKDAYFMLRYFLYKKSGSDSFDGSRNVNIQNLDSRIRSDSSFHS